MKQCTLCGETKPLISFGRCGKAKDGLHRHCKSCRSLEKRQYYAANRERLQAYNSKWQRENRAYMNEADRRRTALIRALPDSLGDVTAAEVCRLTGETDTQVDHVIPFNTGHGGNVPYNVWTIARRLNQSKRSSNVFTWAHNHPDINLFTFRAAIRELSEKAGLTPEQFEEFVGWCHANPRTAEEITQDPRDSIDIWRESTAKTIREAA